MDLYIQQRLFVFGYAGVVALIFSYLAWKLGVLHLKPLKKSSTIPVKLMDVVGVFAVFLVVELLIVPLCFLGSVLWMTGGESLSHFFLRKPEAKGWVNLLTIALGSMGVLCYCAGLHSLKRRVLFWGEGKHTVGRFLGDLTTGFLTWFFCYPFVIMVGQAAGIITALCGYQEHVEQVAVKHLKEMMSFPFVFGLMVLSIIFLVPLAEEILFRGFLQRWFIQKKGRWQGIIISSIIFALFHFSFHQYWDNVELLCSLFVLSCFLGYIYERQSSLWAPVGLHMTFNAVSIALILMTSPVSLFSQEDEEEKQETPPSKEMMESYLHSTIQGSNTFGFEVYAKLRNSESSFCFSPYSLSSSLALPFSGAAGTTQGDMRIVMHYLNRASGVIDSYAILNKLYSTPWYLGPNESRIFQGNSLWLQRDIKILPKYLETLPANERILIKTIDFMRNSEGARLNMNNWVREKTEGRIAKQFSHISFNKNTQMVVASSIFMKGVWSTPFDPSLTKESPFFIDAKTTGSVNMMLTSGKFRIYRNSEFTLVELPYRPDYKGVPALALFLILPTNNFGLASVEQKFYGEGWNNWVTQLKEEGVVVSLPSFSFSQSFEMTQILKSLGMGLPFSDHANFSGLVAQENLSMSEVIHDVSFSIDEKGSEAIAANPLSIHLQDFLSQSSTLAFTANHPFIFLVVDKMNGLIIFMGRFLKP